MDSICTIFVYNDIYSTHLPILDRYSRPEVHLDIGTLEHSAADYGHVVSHGRFSRVRHL